MNRVKKIALAGLLAAGSVQADDDLNALLLADTATQNRHTSSDIHWYAESAIEHAVARNDFSANHNQRLSLDLLLDKKISAEWRALLADRLDFNWRERPGRQDAVNTLKEAYLSWQPGLEQMIDFGRINAYQGVANGYNPTDFFRTDAVRSVISVDPSSLKKNRMGSVMLRAQKLWAEGSITAMYSPKISEQGNTAALNPDFGATNHQQRWLLALSQQFTKDIAPQLLIFGSKEQSPQIGLNLTTLVNDATVAYFEWSGGRLPSLMSQALLLPDDTAFRQHLSTGVTYTTENKLSLTAEFEFNGTAPYQAQWAMLRRGSPLNYTRYRMLQQSAQELATRQEMFLYANWQDVMFPHLDLSAMLKMSLVDHSRLTWLEARYHLDRVDLALQFQVNSGDAVSTYGATPQQRSWQASLRYYF
ncbi:MAG: hypothetical protein KGM99_05470 [Burkholderiales bacterium]|nr:hypothetical protein [Burkholderiales bacterium]